MNKKAHLAGIGFSTIFGFSFFLSKVALTSIPPLGILAYRFLAALIVFYMLKTFNIIHFKFRKSMLIALLPVIIFQPVLYFIFEVYGLRLTTSGEGGLMIALIPIFVTILSAMLLKEKPTFWQVIFILISVSGVIVIQTYKSLTLNSSIWGFVLLLGAVISAAIFNITSRHASKRYKAIEITYLMMMAGAISFNMIYIIDLLFKGNIAGYVTYLFDWQAFLSVFVLGSIVSTAGFFLVNYTLHHIPAHISSIYTNLSTVVTLIVGSLFLQEAISIYHIIGSILIISGVYGTIVFQNKKAAKKATS